MKKKSITHVLIIIVSFFLLIINCEILFAQTDTNIVKKKLVLSTNLENIFFILPDKITFAINDYKLRNSMHISLFTPINMFQSHFPSFESGFRHYFFDKFGIFTGVGYACFVGGFQFIHKEGTYFKNGTKYPYKEFVSFNTLQFLKLQNGFFYRYKGKRFGIFEANINVVFQYPTNFSNRYLYESQYNFLYHFYPNLEIGYYFKRNKQKL